MTPQMSDTDWCKQTASFWNDRLPYQNQWPPQLIYENPNEDSSEQGTDSAPASRKGFYHPLNFREGNVSF